MFSVSIEDVPSSLAIAVRFKAATSGDTQRSSVKKMNAGGPSVSTAEGFLEVAKGTEAGSGHHKPQHASLALARLHFE